MEKSGLACETNQYRCDPNNEIVLRSQQNLHLYSSKDVLPSSISFESGYVVRVAKHFEGDWFMALR